MPKTQPEVRKQLVEDVSYWTPAEKRRFKRLALNRAAPELLAACKLAYQWLMDIRNNDGIDLMIDTQPKGFGFSHIEAAIRKAEGGE